MLVELHEEQDLGPLFERSQKEPVVLFKHSTQCSRSAAVMEEFEGFESQNPKTACGRILVIEDRDISDHIEDRFGICSESVR